MNRQKQLQILLICLGTSFLSACATQNATTKTDNNPAFAMAMANMSNTNDQNNYYLIAAQNYLDSHQRHLATHALSLINQTQLTAAQHIQYSLLNAAILLAEKQYLQVIHLLKTPLLEGQLSADASQQRILLLAHAYAGIDNIDQSLYFFTLATEQSSASQSELLQLWQLLEETPLSTLQQLHQDPSIAANEQGWISLALINKSIATSQNYNQAIKAWIKQYPKHPALQLIDAQQLDKVAPTPKQITLLLPLTGPLAASGQAIRNAFFAAYYVAQKNSPGQAPAISALDTNQSDIKTLYQQAIQQGSDFIVGPLAKNNVASLASLPQLPIPVLALNAVGLTKAKKNLYSYSLSPVQEAVATANRAWTENHTPHAVMIIPSNDWGQQIGQAFQQQWQQLGGQVLSSVSYHSRQDLYQSIKNLLDLDQSQFRIDTLENTLGKRVRYTPIIRQDIDTIFVVALPNMARQIMPLLKFYYAENIPVYATSNIYDGHINTAADNDMNGLIFSDMPFVLLQHLPSSYPYSHLKDQLATLYPKSFNNNQKLYAFGLDAYLLTQQLPQLEVTPLLGIYGATGQLTLNPDQTIERRLLWAQMDHGVPRLLIN